MSNGFRQIGPNLDLSGAKEEAQKSTKEKAHPSPPHLTTAGNHATTAVTHLKAMAGDPYPLASPSRSRQAPVKLMMEHDGARPVTVPLVDCGW